jgi:hypothetical protein
MTLQLMTEEAHLFSRWEYYTNNPYGIAVSFAVNEQQLRNSAEPNIWQFARQLPEEGLSVPSGEGDVKFWPTPRDSHGQEWVGMSLRANKKALVMMVPRPPLIRFLRRTYVHVPQGQESNFLSEELEYALGRLLDLGEHQQP